MCVQKFGSSFTSSSCWLKTPTHPAPQPPMTVVSREVRLLTSSRLLQDYFKTIFRLIQFIWGWVAFFSPWSSYQPNQPPTWNSLLNSKLSEHYLQGGFKCAVKSILPSSASTQFNSTQTKAKLVLCSDNTATHPTTHPIGKVLKWNETSNTSIEKLKFLPSSF